MHRQLRFFSKFVLQLFPIFSTAQQRRKHPEGNSAQPTCTHPIRRRISYLQLKILKHALIYHAKKVSMFWWRLASPSLRPGYEARFFSDRPLSYNPLTQHASCSLRLLHCWRGAFSNQATKRHALIDLILAGECNKVIITFP